MEDGGVIRDVILKLCLCDNYIVFNVDMMLFDLGLRVSMEIIGGYKFFFLSYYVWYFNDKFYKGNN